MRVSRQVRWVGSTLTGFAQVLALCLSASVPASAHVNSGSSNIHVRASAPLDQAPVMSVTSPTPFSVRPLGAKTVHLAASCADNMPGGCLGLRVLLANTGAILAYGGARLDVVVPLVARPGERLTLIFAAHDSAGHSTEAVVFLYDPLPVTSVVDQTIGTLVDATSDRLLSRYDQSSLLLRHRDTGVTERLAPPGGPVVLFGRLTPRGAAFASITPGDPHWKMWEWRDGTLAMLDAAVDVQFSVAGRFVAWYSVDSTSVHVVLRDVEAGTNRTIDLVSTVPGLVGLLGTIGLSADGVIVYPKADPGTTTTHLWRDDGLGAAPLPGSTSRDSNPVTDGTAVVYQHLEGSNQVRLWTGTTDLLLGINETPSLPGAYLIVQGWAAYALYGAETGSVAVHGPDGYVREFESQPRVGSVQTTYSVGGLGSDGSVEYARTRVDFDIDSSLTTTWIDAPPGRTTRVFSRAPDATPIWIDGQFHLMLGRALLRVQPAPVRPLTTIDTPTGGRLTQPSTLVGWALDREAAETTGIDTVHVWATPVGGGTPRFLGAATMGLARPDVARIYGAQFGNAGFSVPIAGLPAGSYRVTAYAHSDYSQAFVSAASIAISVPASTRVTIDTPAAGASPSQPFVVAGWALDVASASGTGVDVVQVYAYPASGTPIFLGTAAYGGARPDVGIAFGGQFTNAGFGLTVAGLPTGRYTLAVFPHSTVSGAFGPAETRSIRIGP